MTATAEPLLEHTDYDACCTMPYGLQMTWVECEAFIDLDRHRVSLLRAYHDRWVAMVTDLATTNTLVLGETSASAIEALRSLLLGLRDRRERGAYP